MIHTFQKGDKKFYSKIVTAQDCAQFESGMVHPVYATFALARDAEWACRLFVLEMKEENEEGIGTFLHITHDAPAFVGNKVDFISIFERTDKGEIICSFTAHVNDRIIAKGETRQKILSKTKFEKLFSVLNT